MKFSMKVVTRRVVEDTIVIQLSANNEREAQDKIITALHFFPEAIEYKGIEKILVTSRSWGEPEILELWNTREGLQIA